MQREDGHAVPVFQRCLERNCYGQRKREWQQKSLRFWIDDTLLGYVKRGGKLAIVRQQ